MSPRKTPDAERRQLTVMFCDLVGSTALAHALDPEEMREVVRAYQDACAGVIERFGGHIAQYLGDGVLVYFGYPRAHEDDAERAVRAALGIVRAMEHLAAPGRERTPRLAVRIGIHTGLVVVGEIGGGGRIEQLALGETPNLAARLQGIAEPNGVVISGATHRLVRGVIVCRDLGPQTLRGITAPMPVYQVLGEHLESSLLVPAVSGLTPFIGREQEVDLLLSRWERAKEGLGQVVLLNGAPGIGKSRLVRQIKHRVSDEPHVRWECRCSPYDQDSALHPIIDLFQRALGFARDESAEDRRAKIERSLATYGLSDPETQALWGSLLSVPPGEDDPPLNLPPQRQKQKTFEAILALLFALAARHPVLFIVEDLHWVDPSTAALLDLVMDQVPTNSVLLLLTARPEFRSVWGHRDHLTHLTVSRFTRNDTELLVEGVTNGKALPREVLQHVIAKTDGVALFVEEITKMVLESGLLLERGDRYELTGPLPPLAIPATLQDSLMARLDRLGTIKEVAQIGAALGRTFHYDLLRAVASLDDVALQRALVRLGESELLHQRGVPPDTTYIFKHALIQETAYQSMLVSTRRQLHKRIGDTLVERFQETAETQPELVAHHYTEANLAAQAADYWRRAGQRAIERSANTEAIAHLTRGLDVLKEVPDSADRMQRELDLQVALGPPLMAVKGFGSPEVANAYARARELCRRLGDTPQLFAVLRGLWEFYELKADAETGRDLAEQLLQLAERSGDRTLLIVAHDVIQDTSLWLGEYTKTRFHMEQGIALYDRQEHRSVAFVHGGYDPGMACRCFGGHALWYLGYADQALAHSRDALALARELAHPPTLVFALSHAAVLHQFRGEPSLAMKRSKAAIALAIEQGFEFWLAHAKIPHGWALVQLGREEEGLAQILDGLARYRATGAELERPLWIALLADAYARLGRPEQGLAAVEESLAEVEKTGVRFHEAELHRLQGELLLHSSPTSEERAAASFLRAIDIARHRQAKSVELRAVMSLSRLLHREGKRDDARRVLREIYGWFTEGFDTADLRQAAALLDELTSG